jgi:hypothetical protein
MDHLQTLVLAARCQEMRSFRYYRTQAARTSREKKLPLMKLFPAFFVLTCEDNVGWMWRRNNMIMTITKHPPLVEDLRNHSQEQIAELRMLLHSGAPSRPDPRRPGFFEVEGRTDVYYIFKYPTGTKVMLIGVWERESDPVAELVACNCPAA